MSHGNNMPKQKKLAKHTKRTRMSVRPNPDVNLQKVINEYLFAIKNLSEKTTDEKARETIVSLKLIIENLLI